MKFSNSVVLVTGANRGYGAAIAREFLKRLDEESLLLLHSRNGAIPWLQGDTRCKIKTIEGDLTETINWEKLIQSKISDLSFEKSIFNS